MSGALALLVAALVASQVLSQEVWRPRHLGTYPQRHAAYVQLFATEDPDVDPLDKYTLYISDFDGRALFQRDMIWYMRSPGRSLDSISDWTMTMIDKTHYWPNDVVYMPSEVVGTEGIIWTSGFLVPTKTEGHLSIYLTTSDPLDGPYNIATLDDQDYSYHRVEWYDVNHDGHLDALSARFHASGSLVTLSMVWFENPGLGTPTEGWTQHLVVEGGPDVHFRLNTLPAGGQDFTVLVAAEFWNERIALYYAEDGSDVFLTDPSKLITLVIDTSVGRSFDVDITDINLDGKKEILLTAFNYTEGNVFIYNVPGDFRTEPFERHIIATGFIPNNIGEGDYMSPGAPHAFYTGVEHETSGNKPYVFVSGDDDGSHYILTPNSEDKNDWTYTKNELVDTNGTTSGKYAIADIDNDGFNEVIAAGYTVGEVYVYTYGPAP